MDEPTMGNLVKRIERLEQENRRWKWFAGYTAVTLLGLVLFSCAVSVKTPDEVRTKRIVVVDNQGTPRISLGKAKDGEKFALTLLRPSGVVAAEVYETEVGGDLISAGIGLNSIKGEPRVDLFTSSSSTLDVSKLRLAGDNHVIPNTLGMQKSPESIELEVHNDRTAYDSKFKIEPSTASLQLRTGLLGTSFWLDGHTSQLSFDNYDAPPPAGVIANEKGKLELGLFDGRPSVTLGDDVQGLPGLVLGRIELKTRATGTVEQRSGASLVMFDKDGKVMWQAPR
jgi:hypothetical protein